MSFSLRKTIRALVAPEHHLSCSSKVARQSPADRDNPMVAERGHLALIVPEFARRRVGPSELGIYEYEGDHRWRDLTGKEAAKFFYVGIWG